MSKQETLTEEEGSVHALTSLDHLLLILQIMYTTVATRQDN
jgi:hypothetical protein